MRAQGRAEEQESGTAAAEATHESRSIMDVEPGLMVWTVVNFVVLLTVLRFTAWKPLMASLAAREQRIRDSLEGAARARQESEAALARYQQMLDTAKEEARKIIDEGKADGLRLRDDIATQARSEAEDFKTRARRELDLAVDEARRELFEQAARFGTELAEKILRRSLDTADQRRLVEQVLAEYRSERSGGTH